MFTTYTDSALIQHLLGGAVFAQPTVVYVAAFIGDPQTTGVEVSGHGYARTLAAFGFVNGVANNSNVIQFPPATAGWGTIDNIACYDALSGGNQLLTSALTTPIEIDTGDVLIFEPNGLTITLA